MRNAEVATTDRASGSERPGTVHAKGAWRASPTLATVGLCVVLTVAGLSGCTDADDPAPELAQLEAEAIWEAAPPGAERWEGPTSTDTCTSDLSDRRQSRSTGLFVPDALEAVAFYSDVLVEDGWLLTFDERPAGNVRRRIEATKPGLGTTMSIAVWGIDRRGTKSKVDGEWVVTFPDGWSRDSDYVIVEASLEPACISAWG